MTMTTENTWTVNKIRETMEAAGSKWWTKDAMRFFGTRVLPTTYAGGAFVYFVTSEQPPHGERAFSVRQYDIAGNKINTIGELAGYTHRVDAVAVAKKCAGDSAAEVVEPLAGQDAAPIRHADLIDAMLRRCGAKAEAGERWAANHVTAWNRDKTHTSGNEAAIMRMISAQAWYADSHRSRFESGIGDDGFLGPVWETMVRSIRELLNGETGGFDCGTLDGLLCDMLKAEGFEA